jgi:hypothetical protein
LDTDIGIYRGPPGVGDDVAVGGSVGSDVRVGELNGFVFVSATVFEDDKFLVLAQPVDRIIISRVKVERQVNIFLINSLLHFSCVQNCFNLIYQGRKIALNNGLFEVSILDSIIGTFLRES